MKNPRSCLAKNGTPFGLGKGCVIDHPGGLGVSDREGIVGAEDHPVRACDIAEKTQRLWLEQHRVEIEPAKTVERICTALGMDCTVTTQPTECLGHRATAMGDDERDAWKPRQMA